MAGKLSELESAGGGAGMKKNKQVDWIGTEGKTQRGYTMRLLRRLKP